MLTKASLQPSVRGATAIPLVASLALLSLAVLQTGGDTKSEAEVVRPVIEQWDITEPAPAEDTRVDVLEGWEEMECVDCHMEIGREWAESRHSLAWVNEPYQEELSPMRRPQGCWGCHIPKPLHMGKPKKKPKPRKEDRHAGITCRSCHEGADDTILGPFGAETDAHASVRSELFQLGNDDLCITCHNQNIGPVIGIAKDFDKTDQAAKGKSCVACHMTPVERPIANAKEGEDATYAARMGRSHRLQTPRDPSFLKRAFELRVDHTDAAVTVTFGNRCGHRVPGLSERKLDFTARVLDAGGEVLGTNTLTIDRKTYLPVDGVQKLEVTWDSGGKPARVELEGLHHAPGFEEPVPFLDEAIEL